MGRSKGKKFAAQPHIRMAKTAICEEGNTAGEFIDNMPYLERFRWSIFVAGRRISAAIDEHRRRKGVAEGTIAPPLLNVWGLSPPTFIIEYE